MQAPETNQPHRTRWNLLIFGLAASLAISIGARVFQPSWLVSAGVWVAVVAVLFGLIPLVAALNLIAVSRMMKVIFAGYQTDPPIGTPSFWKCFAFTFALLLIGVGCNLMLSAITNDPAWERESAGTQTLVYCVAFFGIIGVNSWPFSMFLGDGTQPIRFHLGILAWFAWQVMFAVSMVGVLLVLLLIVLVANPDIIDTFRGQFEAAIKH